MGNSYIETELEQLFRELLNELHICQKQSPGIIKDRLQRVRHTIYKLFDKYFKPSLQDLAMDPDWTSDAQWSNSIDAAAAKLISGHSKPQACATARLSFGRILWPPG